MNIEIINSVILLDLITTNNRCIKVSIDQLNDCIKAGLTRNMCEADSRFIHPGLFNYNCIILDLSFCNGDMFLNRAEVEYYKKRPEELDGLYKDLEPSEGEK